MPSTRYRIDPQCRGRYRGANEDTAKIRELPLDRDGPAQPENSTETARTERRLKTAKVVYDVVIDRPAGSIERIVPRIHSEALRARRRRIDVAPAEDRPGTQRHP